MTHVTRGARVQRASRYGFSRPSSTQVVATADFLYEGRAVRVGERLRVKPIEAAMLTYRKRAMFAEKSDEQPELIDEPPLAEPEPVSEPTSEPEPEPDPDPDADPDTTTRRRRSRYRRRDLTADAE